MLDWRFEIGELRLPAVSFLPQRDIFIHESVTITQRGTARFSIYLGFARGVPSTMRAAVFVAPAKRRDDFQREKKIAVLRTISSTPLTPGA
jgi:hypothetical protein